MSEGIEWWGYLHTNGSIHTKRYFGELDITEAHESPFCARVVGPFEAKTGDEARATVKHLLENNHA